MEDRALHVPQPATAICRFALEPQQIDVGATVFDRATERELVLQNHGKVPFEFRMMTEELSRPGIVECHPEKGVAAAGQHVTINLKVSAPMCVELLVLPAQLRH